MSSATPIEKFSVPLPYRSLELERIQAREDSPFGIQFLHVPLPRSRSPLFGKVTTSDCEETSNDGSSKLDPIYDEDEDDEEIPEQY
jgi:hypothetical protein